MDDQFDLTKRSYDGQNIGPCMQCTKSPIAKELLTLFVNSFTSDITFLFNHILISIYHSMLHSPKEAAKMMVWRMDYRIQKSLLDITNTMMRDHGKGHQVHHMILHAIECRYVFMKILLSWNNLVLV